MGMGPGSSVSCDVAAILVDTENLPDDPADASDIAAQNALIAAYVDTLEASAITIAGYTDTLEATGVAIRAQNAALAEQNTALSAQNTSLAAQNTSLAAQLVSVGAGDCMHHELFSGCVYFVNATKGDDSNDGKTPESAKATIGAAVALMVAGDAVVVNAGTYAENVVLSLAGMEMWCEIGVLIDPDSGVGITVSGNSCKIEGGHKVTPTGAVGVLVSGDECHLYHGKVIGGTSGIQVTGSGVVIDDYAIGFPTSVGFDIQGIQARVRNCSTVGNAKTIGYKISGGVDTGVLLNCTSAGHQTAGYSIGSGSINWTVLNCSSGGGDGRWVDTDSANVWSNFHYDDEIYKEIEFTDNSTTFNIFKVTGVVEIEAIFGHVEEDLNTELGNCKLEMAAGGNTEDLTTVASLNSLPAGSFVGKIATAGDALATASSAAPQVVENTNFKEPRISSIIVAETGTATYVRLVSADNAGDKDGVIHWHCKWAPLTEDGFVEPA